MTKRLRWRKIGGVNIFELSGVFAGSEVEQNKSEMQSILQKNPSSGLLIDLREVVKIDLAAAQTILATARTINKGGILGQNLSAYYVAEQMEPNEPIPIFEKDREVINYFDREFAELDSNPELEKRQFPRIATALPAELELKDERNIYFFDVVVLNLSEGGLFGKFLDSKTEELATRLLDPYDLKMLKIRLSLGGKILRTEGKVLRAEAEATGASGVAIQFYDLRPEDREKVKVFLASNNKS